jgi:hypothetical protein
MPWLVVMAIAALAIAGLVWFVGRFLGILITELFRASHD